MGKKGVLLDNGKQARSSMALYWNNAANKNKNKDSTAKHQAPEEDMETRAGSNFDKWKLHKEKLVNKLYQKPEKKEKIDAQAQRQKQLKLEQQMQRELLEKELNKNKPVSIPGFKNANQLRSKLHFQQVKQPDNTNNVLKPRGPGQDLTHEEIVQILRQRKAQKEQARARNERIQAILRKKQESYDLLMDQFPPQKKQSPPVPIQEEKPIQKEPEPPQTFFKSQLLQKIERGEQIHKNKGQKGKTNEQASKVESNSDLKQVRQQPTFVPKFIPRALWQK